MLLAVLEGMAMFAGQINPCAKHLHAEKYSNEYQDKA